MLIISFFLFWQSSDSSHVWPKWSQGWWRGSSVFIQRAQFDPCWGKSALRVEGEDGGQDSEVRGENQEGRLFRVSELHHKTLTVSNRWNLWRQYLYGQSQETKAEALFLVFWIEVLCSHDRVTGVSVWPYGLHSRPTATPKRVRDEEVRHFHLFSLKFLSFLLLFCCFVFYLSSLSTSIALSVSRNTVYFERCELYALFVPCMNSFSQTVDPTPVQEKKVYDFWDQADKRMRVLCLFD